MKHYVATDIHGNLAMYTKMMNWLNSQDEEFMLYYLGDAADRGKYGYKIIELLLNDPRVVYLKGNHEDLFVHAAFEYTDLAMELDCTKRELLKRFNSDLNSLTDYGVDMRLHYYNGGKYTLKAWIDAGCKMDIIHKLNKLPLKASFENFDMCHAGCEISDWNKDNESALLWDRTHFKLPWKTGRILIHGHTPLNYLPFKVKNWRVKPYCNNQKYDLDTGCWQTNILTMMCLETREIITLTKDNDVSFDF